MFHKVTFSNDVRISYPVGRVRALESSMLKKNDLERFLEMSDNQLEKTLSDYHYSMDIGHSIIHDQMTSYSLIAGFLRSIDEYKKIVKILLLKNDIYNIKNYLKEKKLIDDKKKKDYELHYKQGNFTQEEIIEIVDKQRYQMIDQDKELVKVCFDNIYKNFKSVWIEHFLDQLYSELFFKELNRLHNFYLIFYYKNYLDLLNIENLIRMKILQKNIDEFEKIFFKNGNLKWFDFKEAYSKKLDEIPEIVKTKPYYEVVKDGIERYQQDKDFNYFELKKDNFLLEILKLSKVCSFGIEPLLAYLWGKNIEYKNLRIIIEGRKRRLSNKKLKDLLRETYV